MKIKTIILKKKYKIELVKCPSKRFNLDRIFCLDLIKTIIILLICFLNDTTKLNYIRNYKNNIKLINEYLMK